MSSEYLYQSVERHVTGLIESGALGAGEKLPSLRALSTGLNASISTVSQAYLEMERKGLVESRPRSGFYVRKGPRRLPTPSAGTAHPNEPRSVNRNQLIQTVLETVGDSDLLPLGIIIPAKELLPGKALARLMASTTREAPDMALDYAPIPGNTQLRRQIALRALDIGTPVAPENIVVTNGAMEALYIALRVTTRPGDTVLVQSPTYFCFLQLLETLRLRAIELPSHPERGIKPQDLRDALQTFDISACILSTNFNNPDGGLVPEDVKPEIVDILAKQQVPLIEDDVSGDLHYTDKRPYPLKHFDRDGNVILCSSFSKTLCPGYRVGWMIPGRFYDKALEIKATTNVCSPASPQMAVAEFLRRGLYDRHLRKLREAMHKQRDVMLHHISRHFPRGTRGTRPEGGAVLWLELPSSVNAVDLFFRAKEAGIGIAPGSIFSTHDKFNNFIRLSIGGIWNERLENGIRTLGEMAQSMT